MSKLRLKAVAAVLRRSSKHPATMPRQGMVVLFLGGFMDTKREKYDSDLAELAGVVEAEEMQEETQGSKDASTEKARWLFRGSSPRTIH